MPVSRREWLKRRCRQADRHLRKAQMYLATIYATVNTQHPEMCPVLLAILGQIDGNRRANLLYYRDVFGGTRRDLWSPGDLDEILDQAEPVPDPHYDY